MRSICAVLALTMMFGCAGGDGRDGRDGADGAKGDAGPSGKDGADGVDGTDGAKGENGKDGVNGADGVKGADGAPGMDGIDGSSILQGAGAPAAGTGKDGDIYIDTTSRDVYQKTNGTWAVITNLSGGPPGPKGDTGAKGTDGAKGADGAPGKDGTDGTDGTNGTDGTSVRTGAGAPAAGLGKVGDVYIDSATGDLYSKGVGGWTKTGSLKGPTGADGDPGVDVKDTLGGVRWFAFGLTAGFVDAPALVTSTAFTPTSSAGTFTFTGANQHGRLAFDTAGSYLPGGVDLSAFESLDVSATATGGAVTNLVVLLTEGSQKGCQWNLNAAAGPDYNIDFSNPTSCYNNSADPDFDLYSVTQIQIGVVSSGAGARTLTISKLGLVDKL